MSDELFERNRTLALLASFQSLSFARTDSLEGWAKQQLAQIWRHSRTSNTWWMERLTPWPEVSHADQGISELLQKLPIGGLETQRERLDVSKVWIEGSSIDDYVDLSLGEPETAKLPVTVHRPSYDPARFAAIALGLIWQGVELGKPTLMLLNSEEGSKAKQNLFPISYFQPAEHVHVVDISETKNSEILDLLADAEILNVFGELKSLSSIAQQQKKHPLPEIRLDSIISQSGLSPRESVADLKTLFSAKVFDGSFMNGAGPLAITCPKANHLHALQFLNHIELVNSEGQPTVVGEPGIILLTSLHNLSQPLIRQQLEGLARWQEPCEFGISLPVIDFNL